MILATVRRHVVLGLVLGCTAGTLRAEEPGAAAYQTHCAGCHQPAGEGMAGAFPPLAGSAFVKGDAKPVIDVVVNGRGVTMPPFGDSLSDAEVADIVSYIRAAWSNGASKVTAAEIAAHKAAKK